MNARVNVRGERVKRGFTIANKFPSFYSTQSFNKLKFSWPKTHTHTVPFKKRHTVKPGFSHSGPSHSLVSLGKKNKKYRPRQRIPTDINTTV